MSNVVMEAQEAAPESMATNIETEMQGTRPEAEGERGAKMPRLFRASYCATTQ